MNDILISVILPIRNVAPYLRQCLDSIIEQDYRHLEIICVDDFSTDDSHLILEEYVANDNRIKIIKNSKKLGPGISRNIGLENAQGFYIHYLDPDDWLEKMAYSRLIKKINTLSTKPDLLYFNYKKFDNVEKVVTPFCFRNNTIIDKLLKPTEDIEAFDNWDRYAWVKLHKREFLLNEKIYYNNYPTMEDMEQAALAFVKAKSICYVNEYILYYRVNRKGSLVTKASSNIKYILKSCLNNKNLYRNLNHMLKYRLLAFDYIQLPANTEFAYKNNDINWIELLCIVLKSFSFDFGKYDFIEKPYPGCNYRLNFIKICLKTSNKELFDTLVRFKKKLKSFFS